MAVDITEQARFFDHLVELVPAKHYYDDDFARMNPRFLAKAAREALKADAKTKAKVAKRERLDPSKAATTLEVQRRKNQESQQRPAADGDSDANAADVADGPSTSGRKAGAAVGGASGAAGSTPAAVASGLQLQLSGGALDRKELLERLHKKVEEARQRRKASDETATQAKEWRQNALRDNAAAKQKQQKQQDKAAGGGGVNSNKRKAGGGEEEGQQKQDKKGKGQQLAAAAKKAKREEGAAAAAGEEVPADFKFARIELTEAGRKPGGAQGSRKPPKTALLKAAEAQKAELEALAGTEEGKAKAQQVAWKAALARASGEKVLDDPKLLRRTLKRESKKREKHSKAWQERLGQQQEAMTARQSKRTDNLSARRQTKADNKKAKREKKLLRPGFEGRKEGFIAAGAK